MLFFFVIIYFDIIIAYYFVIIINYCATHRVTTLWCNVPLSFIIYRWYTDDGRYRENMNYVTMNINYYLIYYTTIFWSNGSLQ